MWSEPQATRHSNLVRGGKYQSFNGYSVLEIIINTECRIWCGCNCKLKTEWCMPDEAMNLWETV